MTLRVEYEGVRTAAGTSVCPSVSVVSVVPGQHVCFTRVEELNHNTSYKETQCKTDE